MSQMPMGIGGMPPMGGMPPSGMPGGMPPGGMQGGLPPELMALLQGGGAGGGGQTCPACGQPMPMPFSNAASPNIPMPQGASGKPMPQQAGGDNDALLAALMGGQGGMMG